MKINLTAFLRAALAILVVAGCATNLVAQQEVTYIDEINFDEAAPNGFILNTNVSGTFGVFDTFRYEQYFNANGAYAYSDVERKIIGGNVYHTMHIAGAAIDSRFAFTSTPAASVTSVGQVQIVEEMMIEYVPDSVSDTPPTSVSFQFNYLIQGKIFYEFEDWDINANPTFNIIGSGNAFTPPFGVTVPISTSVVSGVFKEGLNSPFTLNCALSTAEDWQNSAMYVGHYNQPATYDLQYLAQGFVNIVDQNNQPIPTSKLRFVYVNKNNTTQQVGAPIQPDMTIEEAVSLQAISGTNSLVLQWPAYASNYQLETTTNLAGNSWTTNSLPTPVQSGPFLQVTVATTNSSALFRLVQTN
jgi:hypothetical protein